MLLYKFIEKHELVKEWEAMIQAEQIRKEIIAGLSL